MGELEQSSGVQDTGSTSAPENQASPAPDQPEATQQDAAANQPQEVKDVPFHEHPRFKEVIEQKNTFQKKLEETQQYMQQMQSQYEQQMRQLMQEVQANRPAPQKPYQSLLEEIGKVNPDFAKFQEQLLQTADELPSLKQELAAMKMERDRQSAVQQMDTLFTENKIPANLRPRYERELKALAYELGDKASLRDLPKLFKQVHTELGSFLDTYQREIRSSYVQDKKKDAAPAPQTGGTTVKQTPKPMSREDFIKWAAGKIRED